MNVIREEKTGRRGNNENDDDKRELVFQGGWAGRSTAQVDEDARKRASLRRIVFRPREALAHIRGKMCGKRLRRCNMSLSDLRRRLTHQGITRLINQGGHLLSVPLRDFRTQGRLIVK